MSFFIFILVATIFILRLAFLRISKRNERIILEKGGMEYDIKNTKFLTIAHIIFYISTVFEAFLRKTQFDLLGLIGFFLILFSLSILYYIVNVLLKDIWTVKLMVAKNHQYNPHWLFRTVKHPNYYLNIIPELIGLVFICHAFYTFIIIFPIYMIILFNRIKNENYILKNIIIPNSNVTSP